MEATRLFQSGIILLFVDGVILFLPVILALIGGDGLQDFHLEVPSLLGVGMPENRIKMLISQVIFELILVDTDFMMLPGPSRVINIC